MGDHMHNHDHHDHNHDHNHDHGHDHNHDHGHEHRDISPNINSTLKAAVNACLNKPELYEMYVYGTLAVLLVSALSLTGVLILPGLRKRGYQYAMVFFMSLAVGTLTADALLHLIPEALGLHKHSHGVDCSDNHNSTKMQDSAEAHDHSHHDHHDHSHDDQLVLWRMAAAIGSIFFFFVFESLAHYIADRVKKGNATKPALELQAVRALSTPAYHSDSVVVPVNGSPQIKRFDWEPSVCAIGEFGTKQNGLQSVYGDHGTNDHSHSKDRPRNDYEDKKICGLKPVAFMILLSDSLHNFVDGIAMGSAFSAGTISGLSTTIAVVFHELPHEIGDFAVLLQAGMSVKWAMLLNFLSALTAVLGLYVGIALAAVENLQQWTFAIVAGMFIYIALVDMVHEIRILETANAGLRYICATGGVLIGIGILLLLAYLEPYMQLAT